MSLVLSALAVWLVASLLSGLFIGCFCSLNGLWRDDQAGAVAKRANGPMPELAARHRRGGETQAASSQLAEA